MTYRVVLVTDKDRRESAGEFDDFDEACEFTIKVADDIGNRFGSDTADMPRLVEIYDGARVEISFTISLGGLLVGE